MPGTSAKNGADHIDMAEEKGKVLEASTAAFQLVFTQLLPQSVP
jgi:hypothetical protein